MQAKDYPGWTQVTRLVEGGETSAFKQHFDTWSEDPVIGNFTSNSKKGKTFMLINIKI